MSLSHGLTAADNKSSVRNVVVRVSPRKKMECKGEGKLYISSL